MPRQESLFSIVQKFKKVRAVEQASAEKIAVTKEVSRKQKEFFELQGFLGPILETVARRLSFLEEVGVTGLINEVAETYGKERKWQFVVPEFYRDKPDFDYPGKDTPHERYDPGSSIETKVLFSKIAVSPEPKELGLAALEKDMSGGGEGVEVDGWIDFETRRGLYKKAARKPRKLGLCLEVNKEVLDDRELEGTGFSRPWVSTYEVTRRTGFIVFEDNPDKIIIYPHGRSGDRVFDLRSKTAIIDLKNYLGEIIANGGDVSEISYAEIIQSTKPRTGPGWAGKG